MMLLPISVIYVTYTVQIKQVHVWIGNLLTIKYSDLFPPASILEPGRVTHRTHTFQSHTHTHEDKVKTQIKLIFLESRENFS